MNPEEDPQTEDYLDFELEIGTGSGRMYPVAMRSAAGEARVLMQFPLDDLALENQLLTLQNALLRSGEKSRHILLPEEQSVQDFGLTLFKTLFVGEIGNCYAISQREAEQQGKGLRVKLRILSPEMEAIPWEFLYDPSRAEYVCLSRNTPVVRYLELPQPPQPLPVTLPLQILGMIATPTNLPALDVTREKERMEKALESLQQRELVQLTWLIGQTWRDVQQAMREGPWHIFHFIGHGSFDPLSDEGEIAFADEQGQADLFRATQLGRLLADHRSLRLVVLNACESAKSGRHDVFSSAAANLVRHGIPAVLAMQYTITDAAAIAFSRSFYEALADGLPIDAAVSEARKAVCFGMENTLEWGIPVLFMRSPDGVLFTVSQGPTSEEARAHRAEEERARGKPQLPIGERSISRRTILIGLAGVVVVSGTASVVWLVIEHEKNRGISMSNWTLNGNAGTYPPNDFLGTTDPQPLVLKVNKQEAMRVYTSGKVGIGIADLADPLTQLHVREGITTGLGRVSSAGRITFLSPDGYAWFHIDNGPPGGRPLGRLRISYGGSPGEHEIMSLDQDNNVTIYGNLSVKGQKNFVQDHPTDPTREVVYVALEGGEASTFIRGTGTLVNGKSVIDLPEHFGLVTSQDGLTAQLTPRGEWLQLYVGELSTGQLVVREAQGKNGQFDYFIQGVRKGHEHHQVIREMVT